MKIYNTQNHAADEFAPLSANKVTLYTCGPTVYDSAHIGNLRTYIFEDILKRALELAGFTVNHVMNITDVDDKTIKKSGGDKEKLTKETRQIEANFISDLKKLNIQLPQKFTRATEYIEPMVMLVTDLLDKGFAYKADDGSIYFSIEKFSDYGKLSGLDKSGLKSGARVSQDEYDKENPADFVLWKAWDEADGNIYWDTTSLNLQGASPLIGKGRPGWHIECSAMAQETLGDTIDIHAGAVDLIFPHHENEIAQSEARTGKPFARFWVHAEHLLVDGKKMSKSLNNFYKMDDLIEKGFDPLDFRYLCLQANYRSKLNFTWEALEAARNARIRLSRIAHEIRNSNKEVQSEFSAQNSKYLKELKDKIEEDLNTPEAMAVVWEMVRDKTIPDAEKAGILAEMDKKVLGLSLFNTDGVEIPAEVEELLVKRNEAKNNKNFELADKIRDEIELKGYKIEDTAAGSKLIKA